MKSMNRWVDFIGELRDRFKRSQLTEAHFYLILHYASSRGIIGRYCLKSLIKLEESLLRRLLEVMKEHGVLESTRGGHRLTDKGSAIYGEVSSMLKILDDFQVPFLKSYSTAGILIKRVRYKIKDGIKERDLAIKLGAEGAIVLVCEGDKLIFPDSKEEVDRWYPNYSNELTRKYGIENGDALLITFSHDKLLSTLSGINVALRLLYS